MSGSSIAALVVLAAEIAMARTWSARGCRATLPPRVRGRALQALLWNPLYRFARPVRETEILSQMQPELDDLQWNRCTAGESITEKRFVLATCVMAKGAHANYVVVIPLCLLQRV